MDEGGEAQGQRQYGLNRPGRAVHGYDTDTRIGQWKAKYRCAHARGTMAHRPYFNHIGL